MKPVFLFLYIFLISFNCVASTCELFTASYAHSLEVESRSYEPQYRASLVGVDITALGFKEEEQNSRCIYAIFLDTYLNHRTIEPMPVTLPASIFIFSNEDDDSYSFDEVSHTLAENLSSDFLEVTPDMTRGGGGFSAAGEDIPDKATIYQLMYFKVKIKKQANYDTFVARARERGDYNENLISMWYHQNLIEPIFSKFKAHAPSP
jgi:hypothetical protein